jgi:hypothetical protein
MMLSRRLQDDMVHSPAVREARAHAYALMGLWAKDRYLAHARNCRSLQLFLLNFCIERPLNRLRQNRLR